MNLFTVQQDFAGIVAIEIIVTLILAESNLERSINI